MNKTFVETPWFTSWIAAQGEAWDRVLMRVQNELMAEPNAGDPIKRAPGLRKTRASDPARGKGKQGGTRVIYLHVPEADTIALMDAYDKGAKNDLSVAEEALLVEAARRYKAVILAGIQPNTEGEHHD